MSEEIRDVGDPAPTPDGYPGDAFQGTTGSIAGLPVALGNGRATVARIQGLAWYVDLDISRLDAIAAEAADGKWVAVWDKAANAHKRLNLDTLAAGIPDAPNDGQYYARRNLGWSVVSVDLSGYLPLAGGTMTGKLALAASAVGAAGLNLGAGVAPTAPVNGDVWATTAAVLARLNGNSRTLAMKEVDNVFTTRQTFVTSTTGAASLRIPPGAAPTTPSDGDMWQTAAGGLFFRHGSNTRTIQFVETLATYLTDAPSDGTRYGRLNGAWSAIPAAGIADAPSDGSEYVRKNAAWAVATGGGGGITDAPSNGTTYGRLNAAWTAVLPIAGGTLTGKLTTVLSATGAAGFNLPHGAAPTTPVNGDMWTTTGAVFARLNGVTYTLAVLQLAQSFTAKQTFATPTTSIASINLPHGVAPTTPVNGDMWTTSTDLAVRITAGTYNSAWKNADNNFNIKQSFMASASGSASIRIQPGTAPSGPLDGDVWYTTAGGLYVRHNTVTRQVAWQDQLQPTLLADTAPAVGVAGALWFDSDSGNTYISNGTVWLMIAGPSTAPVFRGCHLMKSAAQSIPNGNTAATWDTEIFDTDGFHSTVTNTDRFTVPAGVNYIELTAQIDWAVNTSGERAIWILDQGGNFHGFVRSPVPASGGGSELNISSGPISVVAGNWFQLQCYQTTGSALNMNAAGGRSFFKLKVAG